MAIAHAEPVSLARRTRPRLQRGTYYVQTWGCQMNEEDSEQIALYLEGIGFSPALSVHEAHVILLNTCSVRKKPEDKAFSMLGELIPLKKARPDLILGVCGCMAQARADEIQRRAPHVDFVVGTGQISAIPGLVEEAAQRRRFQRRIDLPVRSGAVVADMPLRQVRRAAKLKAFVPIQYGCDKFCTFCIVPTTRGRERSRPTADILDEVTRLVEHGTREITLLGQTVNSYGKNMPEGKVPFSELLWKLAEIEGLERIRYTSPYPRDFRPDLIATIRDCPKVMEHCHLPMQSGDNAMLREMHRVYTVESYREIVDRLRSEVPGIAITTDMIVGFPGETDDQHENSLNVMRSVKFDGAYMFAYSVRPGTPAGDRSDQVPEPIKKCRLNQMIELQNDISLFRHRELVGKRMEVLVEGPSAKQPDTLQGYTREYRKMHFAGSQARVGRITGVIATEAHRWGLSGELTVS